jgi:glycosyltransferase involved in cell wall biosynthesis
MSRAPLLVCAKSRWEPAVRREHALAQVAAEHGHRVVFIERPGDVRDIGRRGVRTWAGDLGGTRAAAAGAVELRSRATLAPGHRAWLAEKIDNVLLRRCMRATAPEGGAAVASLPWQWPALAAGGGRRVFDCTDDWSALIPNRARRVRELYRRVAAEADAVVAVSEQLGELFPGRAVTVVPNAVFGDLIAADPAPPPRARRMLYLGTLSPRLDAPLLAAALDELPGWRIGLYGECLYPGTGGAPDEELRRLLDRDDRRVAWHGPVPRRRVGAVLDGADVLILPNRAAQSRGQDAMKLYAYAARGRPIVSTRWADNLAATGPPHTRLGDTPGEFAASVRAAAREPRVRAAERIRWARRHTWSARWPAWSEAVFGASVSADGDGGDRCAS